MPKNPEVSHEVLLEELKKRPKIFIKNKRKTYLAAKNDSVWTDIKNSLELKQKASSICIHVHKNVKSIKTILISHFKIKNFFNVHNKKHDDPEYTPYKLPKNPKNCKELNFVVTLPTAKVVNLNSGSSKKTAANWTNELRAAIIKEKKLPCALSLDGYTTKEKFIFFGKCIDNNCSSHIRGESKDVSKEELNIHVQCYSTYQIKHTKKNRLAGKRREEYKAGAVNVRCSEINIRNLANSSKNSLFESPDLVNSIVGRKARVEAIDEDIGYDKFKGLSMTNQKFLDYCNVRKFCPYPFYVFTVSDDQIKLWNRLQNKQLPLSIDGSGQLFLNFKFENLYTSKPIFAYPLVIGFEGKIIPLFFMASSQHHVPVIEETFDLWIEKGAKIPKEMSTDGSLVLQNGVCLSFNKCTFKEYNLICYEILNDLNSHELPACYYRHDVAHLLRAVKEWECLKNVHPNIIDFYVRCIGSLTIVEDLLQFKQLVSSIVVIYSSEMTDQNQSYKIEMEHLSHWIKTHERKLHNLTSIHSGTSSIHEIEDYSEQKNDKNALIAFVDETFERAKKKVKQIRSNQNATNEVEKDEEEEEDEILSPNVNFYFCPDFEKNFKNLCYTFCCWTNVMKKIYDSPNDSGNSCRSETEFKLRKERIPQPISAPKVLLKEKVYAKALTNFGFLKVGNQNELEKPEKRKSILESVNLSSVMINNHFGDVSHLSISSNIDFSESNLSLENICASSPIKAKL